MALPPLNRFPADPTKPPPPPVELWYSALVALVNELRASGISDAAAITALQVLTANLPADEIAIAFFQTMLIGSGQIQFPATQNPSSNANVLDDYEEGAWTPTDASGAGLTLAVADGSYIKIGQFVMAAAQAAYPATASGAAATLGGLPFTVPNRANFIWSAPVGYGNAGFAFTGLPMKNSTVVQFWTTAGAAVTNLQFSGAQVNYTALYQAA